MNLPINSNYQSNLFFATSTVVGWVDLFTREHYRDIIYKSFQHCVQNELFKLHCFVIMTNHFHCIISGDPETMNHNFGRMKRAISTQIHKEMIQANRESRKEWMLNLFEFVGKSNYRNDNFQLWQQGYKVFPIWTPKVLAQKFHYIHNNPIKAGFVTDPTHWAHSSARQYAGLLPTFPIEPVDVYY